MIPVKRVDIKFCPFCGKGSKIGYDGFLLRCYECGRTFKLKEH